jgi:hypothetical protein
VIPTVGRAALLAGLLACGSAGPAAALDDPTGVWTLSEPGTNLQCRLQLRDDAAATGQAVAMPPGCRRAFPVLGGVRSWSVPDGVHLALNDEIGANILMFADAGDGTLQATGPEGEPTYVLAALPTGHAAPPARGVAPPADPAVTVADPVLRRPTLSSAAVAGHYAVMRGTRDTGCMVTLDDAGRGAQSILKARLAPACRDQGISIFDPVGWALKAGRLVLQARKGHTTDFTQDDTGVWVKNAQEGAKTAPPLGLKRL